MALLKELRLRLHPPALQDAHVGRLVYMYTPRDPSRSYWEGEWVFPPSQTKVAIILPGSIAGPSDAGRAFYLTLPARFDQLMPHVRPVLDRVFREWVNRSVNVEVWQDVTLGGFSVEDRGVAPTTWEVTFETVGERWLGITIPFVGDQPQEPVVDS